MRIIFYVIIAAGTVYAASIITPDNIKNRALAAVGLNSFSVTETIQNTASRAKDAITPQSPYERRGNIIERVEQSIAEIEAAQGGPGVTAQAQAETKQLIRELEATIEELKIEEEKVKEGAVRSVVRATGSAISALAKAISGGDGHEGELCKVEN